MIRNNTYEIADADTTPKEKARLSARQSRVRAKLKQDDKAKKLLAPTSKNGVKSITNNYNIKPENTIRERGHENSEFKEDNLDHPGSTNNGLEEEPKCQN